ncbi:MAG TPA: DUF6443 domain-containing protein, partial [Chitinophagaceae bacterium]|nr:DUF6443 domain-containing protein [Chitinophagaceae bacterium]
MRLGSLLFVFFLVCITANLHAQLGPAVVCPNVQYTYTGIQPTGTTYTWSVTGGTIIGTNTAKTVVVSWSSAAGTKQIFCDYIKRTGIGLELPEEVTGQDNQTVELVSGGIIYNPGPVSPCPSNGTLTLNGHNASITRWESSPNNSTWTAIPNSALQVSISYSLTQTTYYRAVVTAGTCTPVYSPSVPVTVTPLAGLPSTTATGRCGAGTWTLTASGAAAGQSYRWYNPAGTVIAGQTGSSYTANFSVSGLYAVAIVNSSGCPGPSASLMLTIGDIPNAPGVTPASRCDAGPLTLSAAGLVNQYQFYQWYTTPAGGTAFANTATYTANFTTTTSYYVSIKNTSGCESNRVQVTATVGSGAIPNPPTGISASRVGPGNITLGASGAVSPSYYQWYSAPTGGAVLASTANYTTFFGATTTYYVSIKNTSGCESNRVAVTGSLNTVANCTKCIVTTTVLKEGVTATSQYSSLAVEDLSQQITYVDGFGRPKQQISLQASPSKKDMVTIIEYDNMGRQPKSYLPYTGGSDGSLKASASADQLAFYLNTLKVDTTTKPFSQTVFEASSASTVLEKGSAGSAWQIGSGHTVTMLTRPSEAADAVRFFEYDIRTATVKSTRTYDPGDLLVTETKDEQGVTSYTYTDKSGQQILTRSQVSAIEDNYTYTIYDDFGSLRMVIQPEGVKEMMATGNWAPNPEFMDKWCFTYSYDEWERQTEKKIPGAAATYIVYNNKNQPMLVQDGELRKKTQWMFNKYDALGRQVMSGIYTHGAMVNQAGMQSAVTAFTGNDFESRNAMNYSTQHGYTVTQSFPSLTAGNSEILTVNYFDDYDYDNNNTTTNASFLLLGLTPEPTVSYRTLGSPTGNKQKVLEYTPVKYLLSSAFYDAKGNTIQTATENLVGGKDISTTRPDFSGKILEAIQYHTANGNIVYLKKKFYYDHAGRLLSKTHQVIKNGTTYQLITSSASSYNELGQSIQTKLHSENGSPYLQSVDYSYNIRGWLTAINNAGLSDAGDLFGEEIKYNTVTAGHPFPVAPRFDGNMSEVWWKDAQSNKQQSYSYSYDLMGRLGSAKYAAKNATQYFEPEGNDEIISYDLNGNIKTLSRNQWPSGATAKQNIDALAYTYTGNQLKKVDDNAGTYASSGFVNGITDPDEYLYDANGNLTADKNKGITSIKYNVFNLPVEIIIAGQGKIVYTYSASGDKLKKQVIPTTGSTVTTDYVNGFEYKDNVLQFGSTAEGRVLLQNAPVYEY